MSCTAISMYNYSHSQSPSTYQRLFKPSLLAYRCLHCFAECKRLHFAADDGLRSKTFCDNRPLNYLQKCSMNRLHFCDYNIVMSQCIFHYVCTHLLSFYLLCDEVDTLRVIRDMAGVRVGQGLGQECWIYSLILSRRE